MMNATRLVTSAIAALIVCACGGEGTPWIADGDTDLPDVGFDTLDAGVDTTDTDVPADTVAEPDAGCPPGQEECGGICVDTQTDPENCGGCGTICPDDGPEHTDPACIGGVCDHECEEGWADVDGLPGCEYGCTATSVTEICNGVDDNCNGVVDEGFDCVFGESVTCTTTCGSTGVGTCGFDCSAPSGADCVPPSEVCNGEDDDCDTLADEDFDCVMGETVECTTDCGGLGSGTCTVECTVPTGVDCAQGPEICNGIDDNCNSLADEDFDCVMGEATSCTTTCGSTGTGTCTSTCDFPDPVDCTPPVETCDGIDDDCDTLADEDFDCVMGEIVACTTDCGTPGTGTCTATCEIPTGTGCAAGVETCNGIDDDCNGLPDDTFACVRLQPTPCTTTCGSTGTGTCSSTCTVPDPASCPAPGESCNGTDDDCDTLVDETYPCIMGASLTCTTSCGSTGTGTCSSTCSLPSAAECTPPAETCNGLDDDCDTLADEVFPCVYGQMVACTTSCGSTGTGICSSTCALPTVWDCTAPAESCNGADDDCDTVPDDGFSCVQGATGLSCTTTGGLGGSQDCDSSCNLGPCCAPSEVCNGYDDDCSGTPDDGAGMECTFGTTGLTCTTGGGASGTQDCTASCTLGACCAATETCGNGWDDDCDTIPDASEPECAGGPILLFFEQCGSGADHATTALTNLGYGADTTTVTSDTEFQTQLGSGTSWHLVIVDSYGSTISSTSMDSLLTYYDGGGRIIFFYWDLDTYASHTLLDRVGVTLGAGYTSALSVYPWSSHVLFSSPNAVPSLTGMSDYCNQDGQYATVTTGTAAAGFTSSPTSGQVAITVGPSARMILNTFAPQNAGMNNDGDGKLDMVELYENEITLVY